MHHRLPLVRAWEALDSRAEETGVQPLFLDEMHPSALGQEVIAEATAAALMGAGWPTPRLTGVEDRFDLGRVGADPYRPGPTTSDSPRSTSSRWPTSWTAAPWARPGRDPARYHSTVSTSAPAETVRRRAPGS